MTEKPQMTEKRSETQLTVQPQHQRFRRYPRWLRVALYTLFVLAGQCAATVLGKLYYDNGGNSKWMQTFVQAAGFPLLIPLLFYFSTPHKHTNVSNDNNFPKTKPKLSTLIFLYVTFGIILTANDLMHSYGFLYLPLSTYSLVGSTQLVFNAIFSYFLNSQKFTPSIFNSIVLLTISSTLLGFNADSDHNSVSLPTDKYLIGIFLTLGASALFALHNCLMQLSFDEVIKSNALSAVFDMQLYPNFVSTVLSVVGLVLSGEWKTLDKEIMEYKSGTVSYVMTLFWTAVTWQIACIGIVGLIFEVSSLFSIVIDTMELPMVPFLALIFFDDKINADKVIALILALWGFLSYVYQHYLDDKKAKADHTTDDLDVAKSEEFG